MLEGLIGIISGIVSGMGMGGGAILITILVCFTGIDQKVAQASNLIFFIPTSIVATIVNIKNKEIKWKIAIWISIFGAIGALIRSIYSNKDRSKYIKKNVCNIHNYNSNI